MDGLKSGGHARVHVQLDHLTTAATGATGTAGWAVNSGRHLGSMDLPRSPPAHVPETLAAAAAAAAAQPRSIEEWYPGIPDFDGKVQGRPETLTSESRR